MQYKEHNNILFLIDIQTYKYVKSKKWKYINESNTMEEKAATDTLLLDKNRF